jgi:hypothetical protein
MERETGGKIKMQDTAVKEGYIRPEEQRQIEEWKEKLEEK